MPLPQALAADNLSLGGGADGSSKASGTSYGNVKDGNTGTYWSPVGSTGYVLGQVGQRHAVSSAVIRQPRGRLDRRLATAQRRSGAVLASGSGSPSTISFSATSLKKLTFEITSASAAPRIAEFETYATGGSTPTTGPTPTTSPTAGPTPTGAPGAPTGRVAVLGRSVKITAPSPSPAPSTAG
ncbi:hypothetical protein [Actinoplanes nipponensis]|uniref:hypothetical protein n=1 Tax=Actinoplanes nipponensis TaxID=135950 RepID=UPI0031EA10BE